MYVLPPALFRVVCLCFLFSAREVRIEFFLQKTRVILESLNIPHYYRTCIEHVTLNLGLTQLRKTKQNKIQFFSDLQHLFESFPFWNLKQINEA